MQNLKKSMKFYIHRKFYRNCISINSEDEILSSEKFVSLSIKKSFNFYILNIFFVDKKSFSLKFHRIFVIGYI